MIHFLRTAWDRLSLFLPILFMGVLALGTYWLVRSTPQFAQTSTEQPMRHEPDYFMEQFSVKTFDAKGRLKSELFGAQARHYPDNDTLEIEQARLRNFNDKGHLTTASANRALSNGDGSEVQLTGNAVVIRAAAVDASGAPVPPMSFRGESLHAIMATEQLKSDKPVELARGQDRFTADSMAFDNIKQVLQLRGRVHGTLVPGTTP